MIESSFQHCYGIGPKSIVRLRQAGFQTWDDVLGANLDDLPMGSKRALSLREELQASKDALSRMDRHFLIERFPSEEQWRLIQAWYQDAAFLDIETSGLSPYTSTITVVVIWHKGELHTFVGEENLDDVLEFLDALELVITFNGSTFDWPRLLHHFHIPELNSAHIDLRWPAYHAGYQGGLKSIESQLGMSRPAELKDISGWEAVLLWESWKKGNHKAREQLIQYCQQDVLSLREVTRRLCDFWSLEHHKLSELL